MIKVSAFFILFSPLVALSLLFCTGSGSDDFAGASGSGNPGGSVKVAIIADTAFYSTAKMRNNPDLSSVNTGILWSSRLPITDDSDLQFLIDTIQLIVQKIHFILDSSESCEDILQQFDNGFCSCESGSVVLEGPFIFDALTGKSEPPLDSISLPEAAYTGIRFEMRPEESQSHEWPLLISGFVNTGDTTRPFSFHFSNAEFLMTRKGPPVIVSRELTTSFILRLAADHWLDSVAFRGCIEQGSIPVNSEGVLEVDQNGGVGECMRIGSVIRENIIHSGRLEIVSW